MKLKKTSSKSNGKISSDNLLTIADFIDFAVYQFKRNQIYFGHGTDNAWDEAVYLILELLNLSPDADLGVLSRKLTATEKKELLTAINRRVQERIPVAYLTNEAWFAGLSFYVDERVLIPRSPLAELVKKRFAPWIKPEQVKRILDLGTGSGCIAISAAYAFPKAKIDAIDIAAAALKVAAINALRHQTAAKKISWLRSDLFTKLKEETYDIIISNPPYVSNLEMRSLPAEYRCEPKGALAAGKNGDEIITKIIDNAAKYLTPQGILVVEVGNSIEMVLKKYPDLPFVWLEFEQGEGEAFLITREDLPHVS